MTLTTAIVHLRVRERSGAGGSARPAAALEPIPPPTFGSRRRSDLLGEASCGATDDSGGGTKSGSGGGTGILLTFSRGSSGVRVEPCATGPRDETGGFDSPDEGDALDSPNEGGALESPDEGDALDSPDEVTALGSPNEVAALASPNETCATRSLGAIRDGSATMGRDGACGRGAGRDERTGRGFVPSWEPEALAFWALRTRGNATIRGVNREGTTAGRGGVLDGRGGVLDWRGGVLDAAGVIGDRVIVPDGAGVLDGRGGVLDWRGGVLD